MGHLYTWRVHLSATAHRTEYYFSLVVVVLALWFWGEYLSRIALGFFSKWSFTQDVPYLVAFGSMDMLFWLEVEAVSFFIAALLFRRMRKRAQQKDKATA